MLTTTTTQTIAVRVVAILAAVVKIVVIKAVEAIIRVEAATTTCRLMEEQAVNKAELEKDLLTTTKEYISEVITSLRAKL